MKKKRPLRGVEQLGAVLGRVADIVPPRDVREPRAPVSPRDWEAAVGTRIAGRTLPVKLDRGVLHVRVAGSTWAQELAMLSEPIIAQLRARGVQVDTLRFRAGNVEAPERSKTREETVRTSPPVVDLPAALIKDVEGIQDAGLRDAIRLAAQKNLGWQRMRSRALAFDQANVRRDNPTSAAGSTPRPGARDLRFVGPENDRPDQAAERASASPRRKSGLV